MGMAEEEEDGTMGGWLVEEEKEGYEKISVRRRPRVSAQGERERGRRGEGR